MRATITGPPRSIERATLSAGFADPAMPSWTVLAARLMVNPSQPPPYINTKVVNRSASGFISGPFHTLLMDHLSQGGERRALSGRR